MTVPAIIYLHGFASSPGSAKARAFVERVGPLGWKIEIPRLDGGDFSTLTLSDALGRVDEAADRIGAPYALVGSSMGGWLALAHASQRRALGAVVMAPAIDFPNSFGRWFSAAEMDRWRTTGWTEVDHHETGGKRRLSYRLVEDAAKWAGRALRPTCPVLAFHGRRDDVVPPDVSVRFAHGSPNVDLRLLDDDHQLLASVPAILDAGVPFLSRLFG